MQDKYYRLQLITHDIWITFYFFFTVQEIAYMKVNISENELSSHVHVLHTSTRMHAWLVDGA